ncbi:hypothetical protein BGZ76_007048, partial [Entomortierella beljakovae]
HVPKAVNTVLVRIAIFYLLSIFLLGSIIPVGDPDLANPDGSATNAPFTIVFKKAGINAAANYMNAVVFTSVFSATNSDFYVATRMLLSLSRNGWAPKAVGYVNARGVPIVALAIVTLFACISLITIYVGAGIVFGWLVSIIGSIIFQSWILILLLHFRFRYCWKKQGRPVSDLPYVSWGYPFGNILATLIGVGCIIANWYLSIAVGRPDASLGTDTEEYKTARDNYAKGLLGAWFPWVFSAILFCGYKFTQGTKFVKPEEADLDTGRFIPTESDKADMTENRSLWKRIVFFFI